MRASPLVDSRAVPEEEAHSILVAPSRSKMHRSGVRKIIFALPLAGLGAGALVARDKTPPMLLRLAVAGAVSLYHLLEHSTTQRHGEFPLLYNAWAMVLPDGRYASAASFGIKPHRIRKIAPIVTTCRLIILVNETRPTFWL